MASDLDMDITSLETWQETTSDESNALDNGKMLREKMESFSISEMGTKYGVCNQSIVLKAGGGNLGS